MDIVFHPPLSVSLIGINDLWTQKIYLRQKISSEIGRAQFRFRRSSRWFETSWPSHLLLIRLHRKRWLVTTKPRMITTTTKTGHMVVHHWVVWWSHIWMLVLLRIERSLHLNRLRWPAGHETTGRMGGKIGSWFRLHRILVVQRNHVSGWWRRHHVERWWLVRYTRIHWILGSIAVLIKWFHIGCNRRFKSVEFTGRVHYIIAKYWILSHRGTE